ncbi:MAG: hypothetical protein GY861_17820 [bacterium]|nr:hypothetical protein [bacterium]
MEKELMEKGELVIKMINEDIAIEYAGKGGSVMIKIEGEYLLDKLAEAIPGEVDDVVLNVIKSALKG